MIEDVEHLEDAVNSRVAAKLEPPLNSQVHSVDIRSIEAVSLYQRAVRA